MYGIQDLAWLHPAFLFSRTMMMFVTQLLAQVNYALALEVS